MGLQVEVQPVETAGDLEQYQAIVIGSAVYFGAWMHEAVDFVRRNRARLAERPVWLFSSGPTGEATPSDPTALRSVAELHTAIGPRGHRVFRGALDRHQLSFPERVIVRGVKAPEGDYRDWDTISVWAESIARALAPRETPA